MTAIKKIIRQHRDWISQSEGMVARELEYLKEDLLSNTLVALANVSDSLDTLATHFGIRGVLSINDGEQSGWDDVSKSINYRYWALRIRAKSFSKTAFLRGIQTTPNLTNQMGKAGCLLACFIAEDKDDRASSIADILSGMLTIKGAVNPSYLQERKFEPFMIWLYSIYKGNDIASRVESEKLGVYRKVIDSWDNPTDLSLAMMELCRYHLANAEDTGGTWDSEFKHSPFDLLPFEIQAIAVVRQRLGLVTLNIDHPLLSLVASSHGRITLIPDDLSMQVEAAYNDLFETNSTK